MTTARCHVIRTIYASQLKITYLEFIASTTPRKVVWILTTFLLLPALSFLHSFGLSVKETQTQVLRRAEVSSRSRRSLRKMCFGEVVRDRAALEPHQVQHDTLIEESDTVLVLSLPTFQ